MLNRKRFFTIFALINVFYLLYNYSLNSNLKQVSEIRTIDLNETLDFEKDKLKNLNKESSRNIASIEAVLDSNIENLESVSKKKYKKYFDDVLMKEENVANIYETIKARFPDNSSTDLIAVFVAEGVSRKDTGDFRDFMMDMQSEIILLSDELYKSIKENDKLIKQDPFVHQMVINLINRMDVPLNQKAELFGLSMNVLMDIDPSGALGPMSANTTNTLALMKNSGINAVQAAPYIEKVLQTNSNDAQAYEVFALRAQLYYPELFD